MNCLLWFFSLHSPQNTNEIQNDVANMQKLLQHTHISRRDRETLGSCTSGRLPQPAGAASSFELKQDHLIVSERTDSAGCQILSACPHMHKQTDTEHDYDSVKTPADLLAQEHNKTPLTSSISVRKRPYLHFLYALSKIPVHFLYGVPIFLLQTPTMFFSHLPTFAMALTECKKDNISNQILCASMKCNTSSVRVM